VFAACLFVIGGCIGCAIDYGRWHSAKSQMQILLDGATLDAGRTLQTTGSTAKAVESGERHFDRAMAQKWFIEKKPPTFAVGSNGTEITGRFDNAIASPFLSLIGINRLKVELETRADIAGASKSPKAGGAGASGKLISAGAGSSSDEKTVSAQELCSILRQAEPASSRDRRAIAEALEGCQEAGHNGSNAD
jgi:hypothetical protein